MSVIKYGHIWKDESVNALSRLKAQKMSYANRAAYKKFCEAFDPECKLVRETAILPNLENLNKQDPETLREVNEFLSKDSDLKQLPHDILQHADLPMSCDDEDYLRPLIAEKVHLSLAE